MSQLVLYGNSDNRPTREKKCNNNSNSNKNKNNKFYVQRKMKRKVNTF